MKSIGQVAYTDKLTITSMGRQTKFIENKNDRISKNVVKR